MLIADAESGGLGPVLLALLLHGLVWALVAAMVVAAVVWSVAPRAEHGLRRGREFLFGPASQPASEPAARRFLRLSVGILWIVDGLLQAQPNMPAHFVSDVIDPGVLGGPVWFGDLVGPLARAWVRHPVTADAATVWIQVGLGLLVLIGGRGALATVTLWASILWSLTVWVVGEAFGGLLSAGATWLTGAPGAALVYALVAGLLLLPWHWWHSGRSALLARRMASGWLMVGALLQAVPAEGAWTAAGASRPFSDGAGTAQPRLLGWPIARLATVAFDHPVTVNATVVVLLVIVGLSLWITGRTLVVVAGLLVCAATWWLGQDFGVLGGTATDPNTALPLGLLLAAALPVWRTSVQAAAASPVRSEGAHRGRLGLGAGLTALAAALTLVLPVLLTSTLPGPADAAAVAADSHGGLRAIPRRVAPAFGLTDQKGRRISLLSLRGRLVVLTFLDAVCSTDCPLIASQFAIADRGLGPLAANVEFVAIDTNPVFHFVTDVDAFTQSHGLGGMSNWHFLCGPADTVQNVLASYGVSVVVPQVGMIEHSEGIYFITPDGRQAAYLDDGAGVQLTGTYADQVRDEVRSLLK